MLKLYTHPFSIVPWRVRIVLHEKGLDYESVETNLYTMEPTSAFLRLNPFAQIPVLDDDGFVVAESIAILEYLEEKYPVPILMPDDLQLRATARKLMCWSNDYWPHAWKMWMAPRLPKDMADPWTDASVSEGRRRIAMHLDVLEEQLANQEWLLADFTLADVCYAPFVLVLDRVELGDEIESRASVKRWVNRLNNRRSVIETMMPPNP
jgi:glutathione S-transferase